MNQTKLNAAGWVRLVIYVLSALVGIAAVISTTLGYGDVAQVLGVVAGAGAAVTGGTAVVNLPKAPDQNGLNLNKLMPAITQIATAAATYHKQVTEQERNYAGRHAADTETDPLPVYNGATSNL